MKLIKEHERILDTLAQQPIAKRFYWTGGTLLAHYYLHHRKSFDLDFFTDTPFQRHELDAFLFDVTKKLGRGRLTERKIYDRWEFFLPGPDVPVRFEFVHYNHEKKRLAPLVSYRGLLIDSLPDIAANKVMAYLDRNQPKDILDLYSMLKKRKFTVRKLLELLAQKFGVHISEFTFWSESVKALKQLDSLKPYFLETDAVKQEELIRKIKYFFLDHGKEFLRRQIG